MHSIGRKCGIMIITAEALKNIDAFVPETVADAAIARLVKTGLRLKDTWSFAFDEAYKVLETFDENEDEAIEALAHFIEGNCTHEAYIPYAKLVQLASEADEITEELAAEVCDLLSEIAEASINYWTKKFDF